MLAFAAFATFADTYSSKKCSANMPYKYSVAFSYIEADKPMDVGFAIACLPREFKADADLVGFKEKFEADFLEFKPKAIRVTVISAERLND